MPNFSIEIASVPDRDEVVAELWFGSDQVAELSQDGGELTLQVFAAPSGHWEFAYEAFSDALGAMRARLRPPG